MKALLLAWADLADFA